MATKTKSVLFICLGNICRSPMAEFVFKEMVKNSGQSASWRIDSAGFADWNAGNSPQELVKIVLSENSIPVGEHRARKIRNSDFSDFDYILSMDEAVMNELVKQKPKECRAKLELLRRYDPAQEIIEDPYCGSKADYEKVFRQCKVCLTNFLEAVDQN
jgi:low molecular weight phosphotyrosine protein phosphatase